MEGELGSDEATADRLVRDAALAWSGRVLFIEEEDGAGLTN